MAQRKTPPSIKGPGMYEDHTVDELRSRATELGLKGYSSLRKSGVIDALRNH